MMQVVGRIGKAKLYETVEQILGAADLQHEQDQTVIGQLNKRVEDLTKRAEAAEGNNAKLVRDLEDADKEIVALQAELSAGISKTVA